MVNMKLVMNEEGAADTPVSGGVVPPADTVMPLIQVSPCAVPPAVVERLLEAAGAPVAESPQALKRYSIIVCDAPWRFKNFSMKERAVRGEKWGRANGRPIYDTMMTEDIAKLPIQRIANKNCALAMWATYPKLTDALEVMKAWGFEYKTCIFTWCKTRQPSGKWHSGLGYYTRQNPELCLLGTRGKPLKRVSKKVQNLVIAPLAEHSAKPAIVRDKLVELFGDLPRVEARGNVIYNATSENWYGDLHQTIKTVESQLLCDCS